MCAVTASGEARPGCTTHVVFVLLFYFDRNMPRSRGPRRPVGGVEAEIHHKLAQFGLSAPGRDWLLRALHPASEKRSPGLPDESSTFVLRPDFRITDTIQAPSGAASWDCFIWMPPGDCNALYWATAPAPADFTTVSPPDGSQVGVISLQTNPILSDVSRPYVTQFGSQTQYCLTNLPSLRPAAFRHQFKSVTIEQIASAVSDQGQVYAAQFAPILRRAGLVLPQGYDTGVPITPPNAPYYAWIAEHYTTILPADERALSRMNPDFYQAPSREGVYMPLRLAGPTQPFARSVTGGDVHQLNGGGGFLSNSGVEAPIGALLTPNTGELEGTRGGFGGSSLLPWVYQFNVNTQTTVPGAQLLRLPSNLSMDTGYDNTNVGVVIFRGLNGSSGGGFGAALQVKLIAGLELAPTPSQGDSVFAEKPAPYEPRAMEAYYKLCLELKGTYPARFNSFEDILDAIGDAAKKIWTNVEPTIVSGLSGLANAGLGMLTNAAGRRMGGFVSAAPRVTYRAPSAARSASTVMSKRSAKPRSAQRVKARK